MKFRKDHNIKLDLRNPTTIDEKLQWIKLYDRKQIYHTMIDKIASRDFITTELRTDQYNIPIYGYWSHFEDIDFLSLPEQFVLKCNHDSGSWIICKDKKHLDYAAAKKKLEKALRVNYYHYQNKQWGYDHIQPYILAEKYLDKEKIEYQVFCNNGIPLFFLVRTDLGDKKGEGYNICYSLDWEKKDYRLNNYPDVELDRPIHLDEMLHISKILSKNTLHLRVDFYETDGQLYIGELTFYSNGGDFHNFSEQGKRALSDTLHLPI